MLDRRALTIGPLLIGLAVWCAAGQLTVATPDAATVRLAVPAPWWVFILAALVAALVPAWRRDPRFALPALLATLPWWPIPLPPLALIWTGPLAWAPVLLALVAAVGHAPLTAAGRLLGAGDCRRAPRVAAVLTLVAGLAVAWAVASRLPGGDEPHYLVIAQSLLRDGDLRIENNHHDPDYVAAFGDVAPHFIARGRNGQIYSVHAPGLPVLVLPAFALFGYRGAQVMVLLLAAITGSLIWRIGWRATEDVNAGWFAWAAIVGSPTFLFQSFTVFPDGPGALAVAAALLLLLKLSDEPQTVGRRALLVVSALLAGLPWLHTRFVILAAGLGLLIVWRLLREPAGPHGSRAARVVTFLAIPAVSAIGWFAFFLVIYGTPNPAAPYGGGAGNSIRFVPGGLVALLFDEQFGLMTYAPVLLVAAVGLWRAGDRRLGRPTLETLTVAALYLVGVATYWMWWAGRPATPARFAMAILPVLAPLLAAAWTRAEAALRSAFLALTAVSLAITVAVVGVSRGALAWNDRDAEARWLAWLGPVVNLRRGWPSFFWGLSTADLTSEMPFVLHAAVWVCVFVLGWFALRTYAVNRSWTNATWRVALGWWLAVCVMIAVQAGWWMTGAGSLDPARSQLALLAAGGHSLVELGALGWRSITDLARAVTIRTEEIGAGDGAAPLVRLSSVPAGTYELRFRTRRPRRAEAFVRLTASAQPLRTFELMPLTEQSFVLSLPAGAAVLTIEPDDALVAAAGRVDVLPLIVRPDGPALARAEARYGSTEVFFLDDHVFAEPDGFWVRGGQTADVVLAADVGRGRVHLVVQNGATPNAVALDAGSFHKSLTLQPSEQRGIDIPWADVTGVMRLRIASPAGFHPSDVSASRDTRFLGVRLQVQ